MKGARYDTANGLLREKMMPQAHPLFYTRQISHKLQGLST